MLAYLLFIVVCVAEHTVCKKNKNANASFTSLCTTKQTWEHGESARLETLQASKYASFKVSLCDFLHILNRKFDHYATYHMILGNMFVVAKKSYTLMARSLTLSSAIVMHY